MTAATLLRVWRRANDSSPFTVTTFSPALADGPWNLGRLRHAHWERFREPLPVADGDAEGAMAAAAREERTPARDWLTALAESFAPACTLFQAVQAAALRTTRLTAATSFRRAGEWLACDAARWAYRIDRRLTLLAARHSEATRNDRDTAAPAWCGYRRLVARLGAVDDPGELVCVLHALVYPALSAGFALQVAHAARTAGDAWSAALAEEFREGAAQWRRWAARFIAFACEEPGNDEVIASWVIDWLPYAERALDDYCRALPPARADTSHADLRRMLGDIGIEVPGFE